MDGREGKDIREIIKNTMLKHEQIFQEQVQELHHLYHVQKLLMGEVQNKRIGQPKLASDTTQTSPFMLQFESIHHQSESKGNFWDPHNGFVTDKMNYTKSICDKERDQTLCLDFLGQNLQTGLTAMETKHGLREFYKLQPKKVTCQNFDVEYPAEGNKSDKPAYPKERDIMLRMDFQNTAEGDKSLNFKLFPEPDTDLQLTLATRSGNCKLESNCHKTPEIVGLTVPDFAREETTECRAPMFNDDVRLYRPASVT